MFLCFHNQDHTLQQIMKAAIAIAAVSVAVANAVATPAQVEVGATKRSSGSLPAVSVKGNGMAHLSRSDVNIADHREKHSSQATSGSISVASTINLGALQEWRDPQDRRTRSRT